MNLIEDISFKHNQLFRRLLCVMLLVMITLIINGNNLAYPSIENDICSWIGSPKESVKNDSILFFDQPAPMFRKEFTLKDSIKSAHLYITAAGYYKASINGKRVGKNLLDPAWTDVSKRVYFTEYEITDFLTHGRNCLGVILGNGFYNPLPLKMWGHLNLRDVTSVGKPMFISELVIEYINGKVQKIVTDETWKFDEGPILRNNVYLGEVYDARREINDWDLVGYDDSNWFRVSIREAPSGKLQQAFFPPIQVTDHIKPVEIYSISKGVYIVDMGVNFAGTYRIKLTGSRGDSVVFRFGERIYEDRTLNPMTAVCGQIKKQGMGGPGSPDVAWQSDIYIVGDLPTIWYQPEFTFHTYRYIEISGLNEIPDYEDIEGLMFSSNVIKENSISTSNQLINEIQSATQRTFLSNLMSVQSDCPAREKFGYGGDLNATSEAFIYNFDMKSFYKKTIYDWVDAINDSTFIDTAPYVGLQYCGLSWESAFLTTQFYLFLYYNDSDLVHEMYHYNKEWMKKVNRIHPNGWVNSGLGDHEALEPVPVELTGTSHYYMCARIMQLFAKLMLDKEGEIEYAQMAELIRSNLMKEFWDKPVPENINRQTLYATLLYYNIVPDDQISSANDSLLLAITNAPSGHFTTGIFGTKYIMEVLSRYVSPEEVFKIVNSSVFPGWGYMIGKGATTLWETWQESGNVYSNCHPMFGSVSEWFYKWLAGIQPLIEFPGFKRFLLKPYVPESMVHLHTNYTTPYGKIIFNWEKSENTIQYEIVIPTGATAIVELPSILHKSIEIQKIMDSTSTRLSVGSQPVSRFELFAGKYLISVN